MCPGPGRGASPISKRTTAAAALTGNSGGRFDSSASRLSPSPCPSVCPSLLPAKEGTHSAPCQLPPLPVPTPTCRNQLPPIPKHKYGPGAPPQTRRCKPSTVTGPIQKSTNPSPQSPDPFKSFPQLSPSKNPIIPVQGCPQLSPSKNPRIPVRRPERMSALIIPIHKSKNPRRSSVTVPIQKSANPRPSRLLVLTQCYRAIKGNCAQFTLPPWSCAWYTPCATAVQMFDCQSNR